MSYLDKKYIAPTGHDFTEWVNTEEDFKKFEELSQLEEECKNVPVKDCIDKVVKALNLGRELQGIKARVSHVIYRDPKLN